MTPEQFEYWITEIRPLLIAMRERQEIRTRETALRLIRRSVRRVETRET